MTLVSLDQDVLVVIARILAKNPSDLVRFGATCKRFNEIVKSQVFEELLKVCQKEPEKKSLEERIHLLQGSKGLVAEAGAKLAQCKESFIAIMVEFASNSPTLSSLSPCYEEKILELSVLYTEAKAAKNSAEAEFKALSAELEQSVQFDSEGNICGGKIAEYYNLSEQIAREIAKVQSFLKS
jgi:hypothetical protein